MKTVFQFYLLLFTFFLLTNCGPKPPTVQPVARVIEKERIIYKPFDAVWQSAIEYFATHNTPIKNLDKNSGLISTEYSLSLDEATSFMECGVKNSESWPYKTELANQSGNFNVIIKKIDDTKTKVNVNVFYGTTVNKYNYVGWFTNKWILQSSNRVTCTTTGILEQQVLNYMAANN